MMIGILGTGAVARNLAGALHAAGHSITIGSRNPGSVVGGFVTLSHAEAIAPAALVVNATTGSVSLELIKSLKPELFADKVVLDVANANADVPDFQLRYPESSLAELIQDELPQAHVVKSLNTVSAHLMTTPSDAAGGNIFLSGNDDGAKVIVRSLLGDLGWEDESILDLGLLKSASGPEAYFIMFGALLPAIGSADFNIRILHSTRAE